MGRARETTHLSSLTPTHWFACVRPKAREGLLVRFRKDSFWLDRRRRRRLGVVAVWLKKVLTTVPRSQLSRRRKYSIRPLKVVCACTVLHGLQALIYAYL